MMKLSEFARVYNISERHARRLFQENEADILGHYDRRGREGTFLDDVAVDVLKSKLQKQFDIVTPGGSERERALEDQLKKLLVEYAETSRALADAERRAGEGAGAVALLAAAKDMQAELKSRAEQAEEHARLADQNRREAEEECHQMELTLEGMRREAQYRADEARELDDQRARAEAKAAELQALLDQIAGSRGLKRRKLLKELKNKE